jgi:hypothetical protein
MRALATFVMLVVFNQQCVRAYVVSTRTVIPRSNHGGFRTNQINTKLSSSNLIRLLATTTSNEGGIPLHALTIKQLKEKLKERGLPVSGVKSELINRLETSPKPTEQKKATIRLNPKIQKLKQTNQLSKDARKEIIKRKPKFTEITPDSKLVALFDKMAKKDGFDSSTAYFADDATFDDDFADDDFDDDYKEDDSIPDFGSRSGSQTMEERYAAAKGDVAKGKISVPKTLDDWAEKATFESLKSLGFRREVNPFGNDETPRKEQFKVISGAMSCSGCGSDFQTNDELKPGFLPFEKFEVQEKLAKIEEMQKKQEKANSNEWTPEDEIEYLLRQGEPNSGDEGDDLFEISPEEMAEKMGLDLEVLSRKKVLCKRCHGLQNFGTVEQKLRPGWTDEPTLSQEEFKKLLLPLKQKTAVILALVDLFDFSGSVLPELDEIAGDNPVILAANKADLLPSAMGQTRAENWVRRELEYMDVKSIANIGGAVRLVSCKTGFGIDAMMEKAKKLASEMECDIYVVGAANAGKVSNYPEDGQFKYGFMLTLLLAFSWQVYPYKLPN